jgi:hypothetical protein
MPFKRDHHLAGAAEVTSFPVPQNSEVARTLRVVPRGSIMDDKQMNVQSLYAKVDHTCIRIGIVLACSSLFAAFSSCRGSLEAIGLRGFGDGLDRGRRGAAATFRLTAGFQKQLATGLKEGLASVRQEIEVVLNPPPLYRLTSYFGYLTGIVGTAIWGYGDLLLDGFFRRDDGVQRIL